MKKWIIRISVTILILIITATSVIGIGLYLKFFSKPETMVKNLKPLLLYNGNIITMDEKKPKASAVLLKGDNIVFVGSNDEAKKLADASTVQIDLKGKTLVPGFNDNHTHSFAAGTFKSELMLWNKSCAEIADMVKKEASTKKKGETICGNLWDYTTCPNPSKELLDKAAPNNPVFLMQFAGHGTWVNSAQLKVMKIDRTTPDPQGGKIMKNEAGDPTGILRDTAMGSWNDDKYTGILLDKNVHAKNIQTILKLYAEAGITSVQDNTWEPVTVRYLQELAAAGKAGCRFNCWSLGGTGMQTAFDLLTSFNKNDLWVKHDIVKYFEDGAFSTRTAWLNESYAGEPDNYGKPRHEQKELDAIILAAAKNNQRLAIHAIGDRAVGAVLDSIEKAAVIYPRIKELRFRIEHIQLITTADIMRMKKLGVVAAIQPFALAYPVKDLSIVGRERALKAYPYKSLLAAGIPLSLGSDAPVEVDFEPLLGIHYAVNRTGKFGETALNTAEGLTPREALYAYTMGSAYAENMEKRKGSISEGKLADMVILSDDILSIPKVKIKNTKVLMTISGGSIVYGSASSL